MKLIYTFSHPKITWIVIFNQRFNLTIYTLSRCEMDCLSEGYKRAVDKILGGMAKNGVLG